MTNLIRNWNGRTIRQREDGYLSATDMCQSVGKLFADWMRLKATSEYLEALSSDMGIPISQLVKVNKGNFSDGIEQGSWVHKLVAIDLAQWCNVGLRVQVNKWVEELLLKGYVSISDRHSRIHEDDKFHMEVLQLGIKTSEMLKDDRALLTYTTQLQNLSQRLFGGGNETQTALPPIEELTVSEVLEREGFKLSNKRVKNSLGQIGKLVKANYLIDTGSEPKVIQKLVGSNHKPTEIKLYSKDYFERISEIAIGYWDSKEIIYN